MKNDNTVLGISDFDEIIKKDLYFVDKTLFIKEFMAIGGNHVHNILQPPKFGKSTILSMLRSFLSNGADPSKFARFEISKPEHESFVKGHCGHWPVIYLSFTDCKGETWKEMLLNCKKRMQDTLLQLEQDIKHGFSELDSSKPSSFKSTFLSRLSKSLVKFYHRSAIVLIDDYDVPLTEAYKNGYYDNAIRFFKPFYFEGLSYTKKVCLMGVVDVISLIHESFFMNDYRASLSTFGFTEDEVLEFIKTHNGNNNVDTIDADVEKDLKELLKWYGYGIGNHSIINPWSFLCWYFESKKFGPYWVDSSPLGTLSSLLEPFFPSKVDYISSIITEDKPVYFTSSFSGMNYSEKPFSLDNTFTLLISNGLLCCNRTKRYLKKRVNTRVYIPNKEIKIKWQEGFIRLFTKTADYSNIQQDVYRALSADPSDIDLIKEFLQKYLVSSFSSFDFKNEDIDSVYLFEKTYYATLSSFLRVLFLENDDVIFFSNKKGGYQSSYSILFEIRSLRKAFCIKTKHSRTTSELESKANAALEN